jgi:hypothetical protein
MTSEIPLNLLSSLSDPYCSLSMRLLLDSYACEGVFRKFRICRLERELQIVQLSATRCSRIAILWVSLVSFGTITLYVVSQRVFIVISLWLSPETFGYTLVLRIIFSHHKWIPLTIFLLCMEHGNLYDFSLGSMWLGEYRLLWLVRRVYQE